MSRAAFLVIVAAQPKAWLTGDTFIPNTPVMIVSHKNILNEVFGYLRSAYAGGLLCSGFLNLEK